MAFFLAQKANFCNNKKNAPVRLLLLTQRSFIPNFNKIRSLVYRNRVTDGQKDRRTDGSDLIGSPEKSSGTDY